MIKQRNPEQLGVPAEFRIDIEEYYDRLIVPYRSAPVIVRSDDDIELRPMSFSMVPAWSKEPKVKFATHNARLETVHEKPTWRTVFVKRHCLVPLTDFIEPIYEGEFAGHMVAFSQTGGAMLYAAGIWDEWVNKESGEVLQSFAIITSEPPPFIAGIGHDRCPIFLNYKDGQSWLANQGEKPLELKQFLGSKSAIPEYSVEKHRAMRPGWEKRK